MNVHLVTVDVNRSVKTTLVRTVADVNADTVNHPQSDVKVILKLSIVFFTKRRKTETGEECD